MNLIKGKWYKIDYWENDDKKSPNDYQGRGIFLEFVENNLFKEPSGYFKINKGYEREEWIFPLSCVTEGENLNPVSLEDLTNLATKWNDIEYRLKHIKKPDFIRIIKEVLNTDTAYAEQVFEDFRAYPIPWLLNRQPKTQSIELLKLI